MIRQGDVLFRQVEAVPEGAFKMGRSGPVVLARGEVTGHAHVVEDAGATLYAHDGARYLAVEREATVTHEEHSPVTLGPGVWEVRRQREYEETRNVRVVD